MLSVSKPRPEDREVIDVPFAGRFHYSRAELIADGVVHGIGLAVALSAGSILLAFAVFHVSPWEYAAAVFYLASLITALGVSFAYNMWPLSPTKWILRRFDHAAIYLLIAGTYTPFIAQLGPSWEAVGIATVVWGIAAVGILVKLFLPGRFDRLSIVLYLLMGWSGVAIAGEILDLLPGTTVALIVAGGLVYSAGVIFHLWRRLAFQNAAWHGFVVVAAALHLWAIGDSLVISRL
ncbi:MAG: hemolysin III family protein [Rhizobiaceae bacterium]